MNIIKWRDALLESPLNYKAKYIGLILSQFYRSNHPTYPSIRTLAELSSLTINPVQEGLSLLMEHGFIKRNQGRLPGNKFLSNIYTFIGVTELEHVSPRDTSNDTCYDISVDISDDTSHDISPRDTEEDKLDKEEKERDELSKVSNFNIKIAEISATRKWSPEQQAVSWKKFSNFHRSKTQDELIPAWESWVKNEFISDVPPGAQQILTERQRLIKRLGDTAWRIQMGKSNTSLLPSKSAIQEKENYEKINGPVWWKKLEEWEGKYGHDNSTAA